MQQAFGDTLGTQLAQQRDKSWPMSISRSAAKLLSRHVARRAILGSVGELVVVVRELEQQCSGFKVFHFRRTECSIPPHGLWFSVTLAYCYVKQLNFRESMIEGLRSGQASTNSLD